LVRKTEAVTWKIMRLLLVSTPRSGNTWFRQLLCGALDLRVFAVHRPCDLNWAELPPRCIVQMHWRVKRDVWKISRDFGFQPIVIGRHPLDVLISILHFCNFELETNNWLDGEGGDETLIRGKDPTDPAFAAYATGRRATALLSVSPAWIEQKLPHVRFEDLVAQTEPTLRKFLRHLAAEPVRPLPDIINENTLQKSRCSSKNHHFWQGSPGLWSRLIGRDLANQIYDVHADAFTSLAYEVDEACSVLPEESRRFWNALRA
jgi:hypothetical protein